MTDSLQGENFGLLQLFINLIAPFSTVKLNGENEAVRSDWTKLANTII